MIGKTVRITNDMGTYVVKVDKIYNGNKIAICGRFRFKSTKGYDEVSDLRGAFYLDDILELKVLKKKYF
jgi:hypothetical protein